MKSPEFREIYNNRRKIGSSFSLLEYLKERAKLENWFDMELAIHDFVLKYNYINTEDVDAIKEEFESLKEALCNYLKRITSEFKVKFDKLSFKFLHLFEYCQQTKVEIYFNYTSPRALLNHPTHFNLDNHIITYVHGSLDEGNIVLGCDFLPNKKVLKQYKFTRKGNDYVGLGESSSNENVNRNLSFMYKYNMLKHANHVARHLMEATEIIFYGHSVNEMDFCYFREFFKAASASPDPARHLTFITLDEKSERDIKDNIRNQGISVSDLYNNLETFEFIHTSKFYNEEEEEKKKLKIMWSRFRF